MRPLLFLLLCCVALAHAGGPLARDYLPDRISSPLLWWALDAGSDQPDDPDPAGLTTALAHWLAVPSTSQRPLPPDGLRLGLLANVADAQGRVAPRILHPALALDAVSDWPAQTRHRLITLVSGARLDGAGDWQQPWALAGAADALLLALPLPALADLTLTRAELRLPLQQLPTVMPAMLLRLHDPAAVLADRQVLVPASAGSGVVVLDLLPALQGWPLAGKALPPQVQLDVRPQPARDSERGVWRPWQATAAATWQLSWQEPAHRALAREQLRGVLAGLLAGPGQMPVDDGGSLWQALQDLLAGHPPAQESAVSAPQSPDADCLPGAALLLGTRALLPALPVPLADGQRQSPAAQVWRLSASDEPWPQDAGRRQPGLVQLPSALTRWQDQQLAPPALAHGWWPRQRAGQLLGWDMSVLQPVPGRPLWPGNILPRPCRSDESCADVPPPSPRLDAGLRAPAAAGTTLALSDLGSSDGQPMADWRALMLRGDIQSSVLAALALPDTPLQRQRLLQSWQAESDAPPAHAGALRWLDTGEAAGYLFWLTADGQLLLLDGSDAHPRWRWHPARLLAARLALLRDAPAAEPERLSPTHLLLWSADAATPARYLYAAVLGELLALDIADPLHPRRLFQADLPPGWLGSLSLFAITHADGHRQPLLLAAARPGLDPAQAGLRLLDGSNGHLLWQAPAASPPGNADLAAGWRAPWAMLPDPAGSLRLYGADAGAQVWRLLVSLDGNDSPQVNGLQLIARLPSGALSASHDEALSLAWLRYQGVQVPALATLASGASEVSGAAIYAWLDLPRDSPLRGEDLPLWPADSLRPPEHLSGWRRPLAVDERVAAPPRWLRGQLVLTTQIRKASVGCQPPSWRQRLLTLPWQRGASAGGVEAVGHQIESDVSAPGPPLLQADGSLRLSGAGEVLPAPASAGSRERLGKLLLPRP